MNGKSELSTLFEQAQAYRIAQNQADYLHLPFDSTSTVTQIADWLEAIPPEYRTLIENMYADPELCADESLTEEQIAKRVLRGALDILDEVDEHPES